MDRKLTAAKRNRDQGLPAFDERLVVRGYLEGWLRDTAQPSVRPSTFVRYRDLLTLHAIPSIGKRALARLQPLDLQRLYREKLEQGLNPRTVGHLHRVLHRALGDALRAGVVARNVCDAVRAPKVRAPEMQAFSGEQARAILAAARGDDLEALYVLALTTGARQGELLGLKWEDLDLDGGRLQVRRTIGRVAGQGLVVGEPKTAKGKRGVVLLPLAVQALREQRRRQLEQRLAAGAAWQDGGWVFTTATGGPIDARNLAQRSYAPLLAKAGLPRLPFHSLRHSCASLLLTLGVHPKVVQELLGHSEIAVTLNTYSHVMPGLQQEALERLEGLLTAR